MFDIISSTLTGNNAHVKNRVMATFSSIFNIRDSVFSDNRAKQNCGVIYVGNSSFSIGSNTFANNSAIHHGVMTIVNSAFDIISST